jgi:hypothetical protein
MTRTKPSALDQLLLDLFTTALEGGINYWSTCSSYHWSHSGDDLTLGNGLEDHQGFYAVITNDVDPIVNDADVPLDDQTLRIDRSVLAKGYRLATTTHRDKVAWSTGKPPLVVGPDTDWDFDADDADCIVQLGLFETVVYG